MRNEIKTSISSGLLYGGHYLSEGYMGVTIYLKAIWGSLFIRRLKKLLELILLIAFNKNLAGFVKFYFALHFILAKTHKSIFPKKRPLDVWG